MYQVNPFHIFTASYQVVDTEF